MYDVHNDMSIHKNPPDCQLLQKLLCFCFHPPAACRSLSSGFSSRFRGIVCIISSREDADITHDLRGGLNDSFRAPNKCFCQFFSRSKSTSGLLSTCGSTVSISGTFAVLSPSSSYREIYEFNGICFFRCAD